MLDRDEIIGRAYDECMSEMYAKSQPSADFKQIVEDVKSGKIIDTNENPVYNRYYLSYEEFHYILNKYKKAYGIECKWIDNTDVVKRYFEGEGRKDVWIPESTDESGFKHTGYRSSEEVPHIKDTIKNVISNSGINMFDDDINELSNKLSHKVIQYIEDCQNFYRFDREEQGFDASIALGCSPTSNKEVVKEYWKKQGVEINIIDRNPNLLWDMDYYGEEFSEVMLDEYGEDWETVTWDIYYDSREGKKSMVEKFMRKDKTFDRYYVRNSDDGELEVINFDNSKEVYKIDDFIKINNIKGTYGK